MKLKLQKETLRVLQNQSDSIEGGKPNPTLWSIAWGVTCGACIESEDLPCPSIQVC